MSLLSPRVSAVRRVAGVRRGESRFAEPTWVVGVVRFGNLIAINANKKRVVEAIELLSPRSGREEPRFAEPTWVVGGSPLWYNIESSYILYLRVGST